MSWDDYAKDMKEIEAIEKARGNEKCPCCQQFFPLEELQDRLCDRCQRRQPFNQLERDLWHYFTANN